MIKKTKDYPKQIAEKIQKALDYNKTVKEPYTPIKITQIEISRGLYNHFIKSGIPSVIICNQLGITYGIEVTEMSIYDNDEYCQMFIKYK